MALRVASALALGFFGAQGLGFQATVHDPTEGSEQEEPREPSIDEMTFPIAKDGKVEITLFYETMCPYCHKLWNESLKPMWNSPEFRPLIKVSAAPAGNVQVIPASMVSKGYWFWHEDKAKDPFVIICQHGESECLGNRVHACAKKLLPEEKFMDLAFCMAANGKAVPERSSFECMEENAIDVVAIRTCVQEADSADSISQISMMDDNLTPPRKYVPWVLLNGAHANLENEGDFQRAVCKALGDKAPAACLMDKLQATAPVLARLDGPSRRSIVEERCYRD